MNELQIFNNPEFGQIRTIVKNNKIWFVGKDVAEALGYELARKAISDHVDNEDKRLLSKNETFQNGTLENIPNRGLTLINESGLYSLVLSSKLPTAKKFKRWVTSEVLPKLRRTGSYTINKLPDFTNPAEAARAWANEFEAKQKAQKQVAYLTVENQMQAQQIAEFKPKVEYVDVILQSMDAVTTTQIAADYGLSAKKLNKILHDEKIQHRVNDQWILYKDQMNKGYTKSETIQITRSDGRRESKIYTKWTQKGRLKIHEILTNLGFIANFDYEQAKLFE